MPLACGDAAPGVWQHKPPHPCHPQIHPTALSLGIIPALSPFAVEVCCESQGRSFAACNSKITQRAVTQPNIPSLDVPQCSRAGHSQGQGQGCPCQLALPRRGSSLELGSQMPLAEAFLAEQSRISADPASSHTRSQQTSHTDPKGCLSLQLSGEILPRGGSRGKLSFSFRAVVGCQRGQHQGHQTI